MKQALSLLLIVFTSSGCTITGNFYLVNNSQENLDVTINLRSINSEIAESYIIRIDNFNEIKIKYSTHKNLDKRLISIDSIKQHFQFTLLPNEIAYIGSGPNTRLWNVSNILISKNEELIEIDGASYGQFEIKRSGLFKYSGLKVVDN